MNSQQPLQRLLTLEGCYNVRDVGGYETLDGKKTRWGTVFRSDSLHRLSANAKASLLDLGLRSIIDLRHPAEVNKAPNVFATAPNVAYLNLPLFDKELESELWQAGTLLKQSLIMLERCQSQIKTVMSAIATATTPILVHCAAGKDRTGLIVALLLSIANVPPATVVLDYAMSAENLAAFYAPQLEIAQQYGYAHLFESPPEMALETLQYMQQNYGGVIGYLNAIGMTQEQIDRLRAMLVD